MKIKITENKDILWSLWDADFRSDHAGQTYTATLEADGWAIADKTNCRHGLGAKFPEYAYTVLREGLTLGDETRVSALSVGELIHLLEQIPDKDRAVEFMSPTSTTDRYQHITVTSVSEKPGYTNAVTLK